MRVNSFRERVREILIDGKSYNKLYDDEKVALSALRIRELPANSHHELITNSDHCDELMSKLVEYLCVWDQPRSVKDEKRIEFEETLEKTVLNYHQDKIINEFIEQEPIAIYMREQG